MRLKQRERKALGKFTKPLTVHEFAARFFVVYCCAWRYVKLLHTGGHLRVYAWDAPNGRGPYRARYGKADGRPDEPHPLRPSVGCVSNSKGSQNVHS